MGQNEYSGISYCPGSISFGPGSISFCPYSIPFCPIISSRCAFFYIPFCPCCVPYRSMLHSVLHQMCPVSSRSCLVLPCNCHCTTIYNRARLLKANAVFIFYLYIFLIPITTTVTRNTQRMVCIYLFIIQNFTRHVNEKV